MASDAQRIRDAAARYGRSLDAVAARYTDPLTGRRLSGEALILKTIQGESGGRRDAVSKAGARAWAQFMPATRAAVIRKYGVDPWRSPEEAVHALTLHMRGKLGNATGLEGYNPGSSSYPSYILGQRVGSARGSGGARRSSGGARPVTASTGGGATPTTTTGTSGTSTSSPFSPGALSTRLASVQLQQPPAMSTAGPALPSRLRPRYYMEVPSSGPPIPPPDPSLPDAAGQEVSFGDPAAQGTSGAGTSGPASSGAAAAPASGGGRANFGAGRGAAGRRSPVAHLTSAGGVHPTDGLAGFPARDYFARPGTAAVAPVNGRVIRLSGHDPANGPTNGPHGPLGWSVYIKGDDGRTYFLTHMGSRSVKPGQRLRAGQKIGTVANYDKYGTPSHIHMGVSG